MTALFLGLTMCAGAVSRLSVSAMTASFSRGIAEMSELVLIIGIAKGIGVILTEAQVLDTIVHGLATPLTRLPPELSALVMVVTQSIINFFIPGGSSQAYVSMPIMAPLADIAGLHRQIAVLAFQMGDGFTNMIIPTNIVLLAILKIAGVPYSRWLRFAWPLMVQILALSFLVILTAVWIGYE